MTYYPKTEQQTHSLINQQHKQVKTYQLRSQMIGELFLVVMHFLVIQILQGRPSHNKRLVGPIDKGTPSTIKWQCSSILLAEILQWIIGSLPVTWQLPQQKESSPSMRVSPPSINIISRAEYKIPNREGNNDQQLQEAARWTRGCRYWKLKTIGLIIIQILATWMWSIRISKVGLGKENKSLTLKQFWVRRKVKST